MNYEKQTKLCKDCLNFIIEDSNKVSCDYKSFEGVNIYRAYIYVPEQFDCIEWEEKK